MCSDQQRVDFPEVSGIDTLTPHHCIDRMRKGNRSPKRLAPMTVRHQPDNAPHSLGASVQAWRPELFRGNSSSSFAGLGIVSLPYMPCAFVLLTNWAWLENLQSARAMGYLPREGSAICLCHPALTLRSPEPSTNLCFTEYCPGTFRAH